MKRILYVNQVSKIGGSEVSLINLIRNLDKRKYEVYLLCPEEGMLTNELKKFGVKILISPLPSSYTKNLKFLPPFINLFKMLRKYKFDLIHANTYVAGFQISLVAKLLRIPLIVHIRDMISDDFFERRIDPKLLNASDKLICISNAVKDHLLKFGMNNKKIKVVHNGVDTDLFNINSTEKANLTSSTNGVKFGIVGQVIDWKGHDDFIDAIKLVKEKGFEADFYIIGSPMFNNPNYLNHLKEKVQKHNIEDIVHFIPFQMNIAPWMNALDVLICPSWIEPFGRVIIEGMSLKKPIIATNLGGPLEIILNEKTGILVNPKDPQNLSEAIIGFIKQPNKINSFGEIGRKRVEELFSIKRHVELVEKEYEKLGK